MRIRSPITWKKFAGEQRGTKRLDKFNETNIEHTAPHYLASWSVENRGGDGGRVVSSWLMAAIKLLVRDLWSVRELGGIVWGVNCIIDEGNYNGTVFFKGFRKVRLICGMAKRVEGNYITLTSARERSVKDTAIDKSFWPVICVNDIWNFLNARKMFFSNAPSLYDVTMVTSGSRKRVRIKYCWENCEMQR